MTERAVLLKPEHIVTSWGFVKPVITGFFANFISEQILLTSSALEIAVATTFVIVVYVIFDPWARALISGLLAYGNAPVTRALFEMMDYILYTGFYLLSLFIIDVMRTQIQNAFMSDEEMIVTVMSVLFIGGSVMVALAMLQSNIKSTGEAAVEVQARILQLSGSQPPIHI